MDYFDIDDIGWTRTSRKLEFHSRCDLNQTITFVSIVFFEHMKNDIFKIVSEWFGRDFGERKCESSHETWKFYFPPNHAETKIVYRKKINKTVLHSYKIPSPS